MKTLESCAEYGVPQRVKYQVPDSVKPREASYYDLVRTPHGHTPAPKLRYWRWLSVPVKELRDGNSFTCPNCGEGSFFKTFSSCNSCRDWLDWDEYPNHYNEKRERYRRFLKDIECVFLPLLILLGWAWYMPSIRAKWGEELHATRIYESTPTPPPQPVTGPLDAYLEERVK